MRRLSIVFTMVILALAMSTMTASATVHEIVGQWCSGQPELLPPGITGGSNADNFAQPLFAMGYVSFVPFDPGDGRDPGFLFKFNFDHPASKIIGTGIFVEIDQTEDGDPIYLELFELDTSKGFANCKRLR